MKIVKQSLLLLTVILLTSCSLNTEFLPDEFQGLRLTKKLTGDAAKSFINKLHHKSVTDIGNEIGFYKGNITRAAIYVTRYEKLQDARRYFGEMTKKIIEEKTPFINPEFINFKGLKVFRTFGMGQTHYVFIYDKNLFWLSVDTYISKKFLEEYLKYLDDM